MNLTHHIGKRLDVVSDSGDIITKRCVHYERYFPGLPNVAPDEEPGSVEKLMNLSQLWELNLLESICVNIQNEEAHLNPSIATSHNTEMGEKLARDFLHTNKWADVSFDVEGNLQYLCILAWKVNGKQFWNIDILTHYGYQ